MKRAFVVLVVVLGATAPALADDAVARDAFRRAQEHTTANPPRWVEACPLFEASYRADPQIGVLLYLADCHERIGRIATAWAEFNDAVELARRRQDNREAVAKGRADALLPKLSKLQLKAPPTVIPGLIVKRDGVDITVLVGTELSIDPGEHVISASAPGYVAWTQKVTIATPGVTPLDIPALEKAPDRPLDKHEGTLTIKTQPDAEIWVDSQKVGIGSFSGPLRSGGHTLRVVAPNMRPYQVEVFLGDNDVRTIDVPLEKIVVMTPAEPKPSFELGASLAPGVKLRNDNPVVVALRAEVALRLGRNVNLGLYAEYGRLDTTDACGTDIPGPNPSTPFDIGERHQFTKCSYFMPGLQLYVHVMPKRKLDPYIGIGPGFRFGRVNYNSMFGSMEGASSRRLLAIVTGVRAGVTYHPTEAVRSWTLGGYVEAAITLLGDSETVDDSEGVGAFVMLFGGFRSTVTF